MKSRKTNINPRKLGAALAALCVLAPHLTAAAPAKMKTAAPRLNPKVERQLDDLLLHLTLEEKIALCSGDNGHFRGVPRLNIPTLRLTDGPRGPNNSGASTAFPAGVLFGATWNPALIGKAGKVMGEETRAVGEGVLLGPGINIQRDPIGGRFFEYYTEDPYLNSRLAAEIVKGIQSEGVAACLKHYACNNREDNRNFYMSMVDQRTLNEIYLPAFKSSVQDGHVWSVMTSANGVNGDFVSDSKALLRDKLKDEWGFDGMVLTDWLQARSVEKSAFAGLDISMPGGDCPFAKPLVDAVYAGRVPISVIDDKARRILRVFAYTGVLNHRDMTAGAQRNTPEHQAVARQVAAEGIVLLKNAQNILPLDPAKVKNVLVLGPSADRRFCIAGLGGSSWVQGPYEVTTLAGVRNVLGDRVQYLSIDDLGGFQPIPPSALQPVDGKPGFTAKYYAKDGTEPAITKVESQVNFMWEMRGPDPAIAPDGFRAQFIGKIIPPVTGSYAIKVTAGGKATIYAGETGGQPLAVASREDGRPTATALVQMEQGKPFTLRIEYTRQPGDAALSLAWQTPASPQWAAIDEAVQKAETVIVVGGIDHSLDTEGWDRPDMHFPADQQNLINRVAKLNPRTVVVMINGSPLELGGWLPNVPAVVEAWYPGMEGGNAVADILFGKVNPSGRLPFSWPKVLADSPSHKLATENRDIVNYQDGLMVGYRYYDTKHAEPQFPFGYGLSYTTFSFGKLTAAKAKGAISVKLPVKNTGTREGKETVQIYIRPLKPSVSRPIHELKAFTKIALKPGQAGQAAFQLKADAFSYYDVKSKAWRVDPGTYEIQAGASSRDIRSVTKIVVTAGMF
jgi:beta-glucosidase